MKNLRSETTNFAHEIIVEWAGENDVAITSAQMDALAAYQARVLDVNRFMNLTRITEPADFAVKHIIDSMTLLPHIDAFCNSKKSSPLSTKEGEVSCPAASEKSESAALIDIGTGAGFPGMVLKIMRENLRLTLLDSTLKRVNFLRETTDILGLQADCVHARAEEYSRAQGEHYDICTARAVASLDKLAGYALPLVKRGGVFLAMKGAEISAELENAKPAIEKHGGRVEQIETVSPGKLKHSIVVVRKAS